MTRALARAAVIAPLAAACSQPSSAELPKSTDQPTEGLQLSVVARSDGAVTQVIAGAYPDLAAPDQLFAHLGGGGTGAGVDVPLVSLDGQGWVAQLLGAPRTLSFGLLRAGGARFEVPIELPESFVVTGPTSASRAEPLTLTWAAPTDPASVVVTLKATGTCIRKLVRAIDPDVGTFTFQPADWLLAGTATSCDVLVEVTRQKRTDTAATAPVWTTPRHPSASFTLTQVRDLVVATRP